MTLGFCESLKLIPTLEKQRRFNLFPVSKCPKADPLVWNSAQTINEGLFDFEEKEAEESEKKPSHLSSWILLGVGVLTLSLILSLRTTKKEEIKQQTEDYIY